MAVDDQTLSGFASEDTPIEPADAFDAAEGDVADEATTAEDEGAAIADEETEPDDGEETAESAREEELGESAEGEAPPDTGDGDGSVGDEEASPETGGEDDSTDDNEADAADDEETTVFDDVVGSDDDAGSDDAEEEAEPSDEGEETPSDEDQEAADRAENEEEPHSDEDEASSAEDDDEPSPYETGSLELSELVGAHFAHVVAARTSAREEAEREAEAAAALEDDDADASDGEAASDEGPSSPEDSGAADDARAADDTEAGSRAEHDAEAAIDTDDASDTPADAASSADGADRTDDANDLAETMLMASPEAAEASPDGAAPEASEPEEEAFVPIITEHLPSYDEEHGRPIQDAYRDDFSRFDQAYQPEPEREIRIPHIADEDGAGYRVPGEGKSRSKARPFLAFLLVGVMVAGIVAAGSYGLELWGGKRLPNVIGLSERQARDELEAKGFVVETSTSLADDGIGYVLDQKPAGGQRLDKGSRIDIVIAVSREMPEVVGLSQQEAEDLLHKAGAEEIRIDEKNAAEPEGTVISSSPAAGEGFSAHSTITLVVAKKAPVPDVVGKAKVEAIAAIENAGYVAETADVESEKPQNTVIEQDPAPGTKLDPGAKVTLKIAQPAKMDPLHLVDYFSRTPQTIAKNLAKQGFSLNSSRTLEDGYCEAEYISAKQGRILFAARPFSHLYTGGSKDDVLGKGLPFRGVRWEVPASMLPADSASLSPAAIESLMKTCGLNNQMESCTEADIVIPAEAEKTSAKFRCAYGETNGNSWTVLLVSEDGKTRGVVTCAPRTLYDEWYDLAPYGNSICDMIAYADVYTELD